MTNQEMNKKANDIPVNMKAKYILEILLDESVKRAEQHELIKKKSRKYQKHRISCNQCQHEEKNKVNNEKHISGKHETIGFTCNHCQHEAKNKEELTNRGRYSSNRSIFFPYLKLGGTFSSRNFPGSFYPHPPF
jgi:hypothetical protein